jgi:predicted transcriptional regulator
MVHRGGFVMAMEITIQVSDALGRQLQPFQERLPEVLERGLREVLAEKSKDFKDEHAILELLTSQPTPEQVLAIRPSPELQARVSELLDRNKRGALSRQEETELERYLTLEHLVRLAKAYAYRHQMHS